jgi:50S ribosomal protein L16 3-hydroxylase
MDIKRPSPLLGGLTPARFMDKHWQKKPLLVRQAIPGFQPLLAPAELFALAGRDDVESRLVARESTSWRLQRGPFARRALPSTKRPDWTLLVQGVDLHAPAAHALLRGFSFLPAARLDDLMISYATDGGGVGPHFDSYDVFLLQAQGQRRWRIGRQRDLALQEGVPLKILARFEPEAEYVLEPGDMLYLPPRYAHDGIAEGECQTYSIGFRAPAQAELARELLQRIADEAAKSDEAPRLYRDPGQPATARRARCRRRSRSLRARPSRRL